MDNSLRYQINRKDSDDSCLDGANFRADVSWKEGSSEIQRSFSVEELESHIAERKANGVPTAVLEAALMRLRQINWIGQLSRLIGGVPATKSRLSDIRAVS